LSAARDQPLPTSTQSEPTVTPPVVVDTPIPSGGEPEIYIVQPGDRMWLIATKFGLHPPDLIAYNIEKGYISSAEQTLHPGDEILIPPTNGSGSSITCVTNYIVQAGDTIFSVARQHVENPNDNGVVEAKAEEIAKANDLVLPYTIYADQTLCIP
jgi:LysM repeat protein